MESNSDSDQIEYICYGCENSFLTDNIVSLCPSCKSDFLEIITQPPVMQNEDNFQEWEQIEPEEEQKEVPPQEESMENANQIESCYKVEEEQGFLWKMLSKTGNVISTAVKYIEEFDRKYGVYIRAVGALFEDNDDRRVRRHARNEGGSRVDVAIGIGSVLAVIALSYGFSKYDPRTPVPEELIEQMEEIEITEENKTLNDQTKELESPNCSICICEVEERGIKTTCNHYFHKDCLSGWLKIHNKCPVCREKVL